jgi:hypothetical protein
MSGDWSVPGWAVLVTLLALLVVALVVVGLAVALVRTRARIETALGSARTDAVALAVQVEAIERRVAGPAVRHDDTEYVVTMLGRDPEDEQPDQPSPVVPAPLFADLVLRESVVQAASLAAGLRRALAPETRHRIRFEMKREVKRARKQRRADLRQARRDLEVRRRGDIAA